MTTALVHSITDEQIAEIEGYCAGKHAEGFAMAHNLALTDILALITRLREAEKDAARMEWLENAGELIVSHERWENLENREYYSTVCVQLANGTKLQSASTLREAIDTAMQEHTK